MVYVKQQFWNKNGHRFRVNSLTQTATSETFRKKMSFLDESHQFISHIHVLCQHKSCHSLPRGPTGNPRLQKHLNVVKSFHVPHFCRLSSQHGRAELTGLRSSLQTHLTVTGDMMSLKTRRDLYYEESSCHWSFVVFYESNCTAKDGDEMS